MSFVQEALFEHRFWLQVLGDHARFIHSSLGPMETNYIQKAEQFKTIFDTMLQTARKIETTENINQLSKESLQCSSEFRTFKLMIIREHLIGKITISLTPSFLNHMVNEIEEYIRILHYLVKNEQVPHVNPIHHHLLWLLDAAGHAGAINDDMDAVERNIKKQSKKFKKDFEAYYLKAVEMAGFLRTNVDTFPALKRFNHEAGITIKIFQHFLQELEEWEMNKEVLSVFTPLMADHMFREECYYLTKLAQVSDIEQPHCNPTKPRNSTN